MDFFGTQDTAQARSRAFYIAFSLSVAGAVIVLYFVVTGCFLAAGLFSPFKGYYPGSWWDSLIQYSLPQIVYGQPKRILDIRPLLTMLPLIAAAILALSYYKISLIKNGGGAYVAEAMGGKLIRKPKNADEKRLINVVEEMALAAGLPRPRVFLMPKEWSINAVTAGLDYEDAIIAVTAGALKHLDREELQGVIAHEYAHILNGDYALNLTMAGWLYGLLFFSVQGRDMMDVAKSLMEKSGEGESGSLVLFLAGPMFLMGLILWIGGWVGKLAAELTQAAMSRQREQLADAFAVQFTRNPRGLAGALKKIAAFPQHGTMKSGQAMMMKSFFIASPGRFVGLMRSHPPLEDRILTLEPGWDGMLPEFGAESLWPVVSAQSMNLKIASGGAGVSAKNPKQLLKEAGELDGNWVGTLVLGMLAGHVGLFDDADEAVHRSLELSRRLFEKIPQELRQAADDAGLAAALIASIFLSDDLTIHDRQLTIVSETLGADNADRARHFKSMMENEHRLPLLGLSSPTLGGLSADAGQTLSRTVTALVAADGRLDLFEIAALQILKKRLNIRFGSSADAEEESADGPGGYIGQVQYSVVMILSALARLGGRRNSEEKAETAFRAGLVHFNQWPSFDILPQGAVTSKKLVLALDKLGQAPVKVRNTMILAAVSTALEDNFISADEYELLRALAAAMDIPLPYFVS